MKAGFLFSSVVVLGVFHKFRAQDIKALWRPSLEGLPGWEDRGRLDGHQSDGFWPLVLVMQPFSPGGTEGIRQATPCVH